MFKQMNEQTHTNKQTRLNNVQDQILYQLIYFVPRNHTNDYVIFLKMAKPPRDNKTKNKNKNNN